MDKYIKYINKNNDLDKQIGGIVTFNAGTWYYFCNISDAYSICGIKKSDTGIEQDYIGKKAMSQIDINGQLAARSKFDVQNLLKIGLVIGSKLAINLIPIPLVGIAGTNLINVAHRGYESKRSSKSIERVSHTKPYAYRVRQFSQIEANKTNDLSDMTELKLLKPKLTFKKYKKNIIKFSDLRNEKEKEFNINKFNMMTPLNDFPTRIQLDEFKIFNMDDAKAVLNILIKINPIINCVIEININTFKNNTCTNIYTQRLSYESIILINQSNETLENKLNDDIIMKLKEENAKLKSVFINSQSCVAENVISKFNDALTKAKDENIKLKSILTNYQIYLPSNAIEELNSLNVVAEN